MKTTLCFTLTLLIFALLTFVPNSFAQDDSPEYVVKPIYFYPNDREPQPDINLQLDTLMKETQQLFADEMEAHGFSSKTFKLETKANGNVVAQHVKGNFNDAYYSTNGYGKVGDEFASRFDMSNNIYLFFVDIRSRVNLSPSGEVLEPCGVGRGHSVGGVAFVPASEFGNCTGSDLRHNTLWLVVHELKHAFGLLHEYPSSGSAYQLSICEAEWLDGHRSFNRNQENVVNHNTSIQMLPPTLVSPPATIRLRFEITDPDGLHQAQLIKSGDPIIACQELSGKSATVEFVTTQLFNVSSINLQVMDAHGNFTFGEQSFPTDISSLLSSGETISIPDSNLAAAVREKLGLASGDPITQLDMLRLTGFIAVGRQITNLTGLEHAIHLRDLNLLSNQIKDITPLLKLTNLRQLSIGQNQIRDIKPFKALTNLRELNLEGNPISDITTLPSLINLERLSLGDSPISDIHPVAELTQLRSLNIIGLKIRDISPLTKLTGLNLLNLGNNQISDITSLTGLTNLRVLILWNNQISDVSPLAELVNLEELHLEGNPIKDRKPLLELLEKNPDVKIYLDWGGEPLPVTLSHFRAEHTDAGVALKWTTESELDNAGFYIYRSETKDGEFKVVNPTMIQGAGTTSERNTYTWKDTTAKPNVAYYYRIEDISHAGVRKQLATVHMRGLVSATGKLTTRWAALKTQN